MSDLVIVSREAIDKLQQYVMIDQTFVEQSNHGDYVHIDDLRALLDKATPCGEPFGYLPEYSPLLSTHIEVSLEKYGEYNIPVYLTTQPQVPEGYALVPIEPTKEMKQKIVEAGGQEFGHKHAYILYKAMLTEAIKGQ